jgi:hypothetical protein
MQSQLSTSTQIRMNVLSKQFKIKHVSKEES